MAHFYRVKNKRNQYENVFGKGAVADFAQDVQSLVIRSGNELESLILDCVNKKHIIGDLYQFIKKMSTKKEGTYVCYKNAKNHKDCFKEKQPDFLVFKITSHQKCIVTELKSGGQLDTKKIDGEVASLQNCCQKLNDTIKNITGKEIKVDYQICAFDANTIDEIVTHLKYKVSRDHCITGKQFCESINISFQRVNKKRKLYAQHNKDIAIERFLRSPDVQKHLKKQNEYIAPIPKTA